MYKNFLAIKGSMNAYLLTIEYSDHNTNSAQSVKHVLQVVWLGDLQKDTHKTSEN